MSDCTRACVIVRMCFVSACIVREDVLQQRDYCSYLPSHSSFLPPPHLQGVGNKQRWIASCCIWRWPVKFKGDNDWSGEKLAQVAMRSLQNQHRGVVLCSAMPHCTAALLTNPLKMTNVLIN